MRQFWRLFNSRVNSWWNKPTSNSGYLTNGDCLTIAFMVGGTVGTMKIIEKQN